MTVSDAELAAFATSHDIISLGMAADEARRRRHGLQTTYLRVAEVGVAPGAPVDIPEAAGEVRITGTPDSLATALARVVEVVPQCGRTPLSGFSLADLEALALREQVTLRTVLEQLHAAGLEFISEAPFDRLRDARRAIEEVNIGGLRLSRLTIHQLQTDDMPDLYRQISLLQYDVAVIRAFAPLPRAFNPSMPTTGYDDVKRIALARLFIEHIPSIQVDWALYGPKLAQVALTVGADDIDGVSPVDDLSEGRRRAPREEVRRNITAASLEPVERDARFDRRA